MWIFFLFLVQFLFGDEDLTYTSHYYNHGHTSFEYEAVTGKFPIAGSPNSEGSPEIFFIAFMKTGESHRPITFIFPGGPGEACGPEAICSFGPRRILLPQEGKTLLPPYHMIDNPESLLPWTDLVFVDPVGTGFSTEGDDEETLQELFSVEGDITSLSFFIRNYISYFNRWNSPKYLSGISYGSVRSTGVAHFLTMNGISIHGLILLGAALDYSTLITQQNRFLPESFLIPTFAATAWYHGRMGQDVTLEEVVESAKRFSFQRYIPAALQPLYLTPSEEEALYSDLSKLIGLPVETVRRYQGKFDEFLYTTEFMGPERKIIGGLDTRYIGELFTTQRFHGDGDPSYRDMQGLYCAFNEYLQNELETKNIFDPYIDFSHQSFELWNFSTYDSCEWPNMVQRLGRTMLHNPEMKVFVGSGYFDCRTPFTATEYALNHLNIPPSYRNNLQFAHYNGGHGFIFDPTCLKKLKKDLEGMLYQSQ